MLVIGSLGFLDAGGGFEVVVNAVRSIFFSILLLLLIKSLPAVTLSKAKDCTHLISARVQS